MHGTWSSIPAVASIVSLLLAGAAAAEPTPVHYTVERTPLRLATASSFFRFELFDDPACTNLIYSEDVPASDPLFYIQALMTQRLKGAPRAPRANRIHAVIDAPEVNAAPFLRVSGTGITAAGGDCQLQAEAAVVGQQGPPGPTGANGADGAIGPQGLPGPQGLAGANGIDGADGAVGPQGPQGPSGPDGADGAQGPQGPQGPVGADGAQGPAGADGAQGPQGPQGAAGADGAQGPPGADGAQGPPGLQGPPGANGIDGADGAVGPQGPQGLPGPAGATGGDGAQGPQGPQGPAGADGAQGPAGADGAQGPPGPQQQWLGGGGFANRNGTIEYFGPWGGAGTTSSLVAAVAPISGTISSWRMVLTSSPGAGNGFTFVLHSGINTLSCVVNSNGPLTCPGSLAVTAGELVYLEEFNTGPTSPSNSSSFQWGAAFTSP